MCKTWSGHLFNYSAMFSLFCVASRPITEPRPFVPKFGCGSLSLVVASRPTTEPRPTYPTLHDNHNNTYTIAITSSTSLVQRTRKITKHFVALVAHSSGNFLGQLSSSLVLVAHCWGACGTSLVCWHRACALSQVQGRRHVIIILMCC